MSYLRKRPRQPRAKATFDAIVEAAARILAEKGPEGLTTNRVAERAGVSVGSLYQYFPDGRAVVRALLEREFERAEALRPACLDDPSRPLAARMRAAVDWHFDLHQQDPALGQALRQLLRDALPRAERERILALRAARVLGTVGPCAGDREPEQVAFLVDVCLGAVTEAAAARRPQWVASEPFRHELAALLTGFVEGPARRP